MTTRLTAESLKGVWAGITLSWDEQYALDEDSLCENLRRLCAARPHGVYTTGSTGEFYVLNFEEFRRLVDILTEIVRPHGIPTQVGCCSDNTRDVVRMVEYVAGKDVGAAQVSIPYWMELTDEEVLRFFSDLYAACPDLPLVHYNIPRSKRFLLGEDYRRVLDVAPNLIGVKFTFAGAHFGELQDSIRRTPELSYFVGENLLVSAMQLGARGTYSSLVCMNPEFILRMFALAEARRWDEAIALQTRAAEFFSASGASMEEMGVGMIDPVVDKACAVASGFFVGHQRTRAPYIGWPDEAVERFRGWLRETFPELACTDTD